MKKPQNTTIEKCGFIILIEVRLKICRKTKVKRLCGIVLH